MKNKVKKVKKMYCYIKNCIQKLDFPLDNEIKVKKINSFKKDMEKLSHYYTLFIEVIKQEKGKIEFAVYFDMYSIVYYNAIDKDLGPIFSEIIYLFYRDLTYDHLKTEMKNKEKSLKSFLHIYEKMMMILQYSIGFLSFIDKEYLPKHKKLSIRDSTIEKLKIIFYENELKDVFQENILETSQKYRNNELVNVNDMAYILKIFYSFSSPPFNDDIYQDTEQKMIKIADSQYKMRLEEIFTKHSKIESLFIIHAFYISEKQKMNTYIPQISHDILQKTFKHCIFTYIEDIINNEFFNTLMYEKKEEIKLMYYYAQTAISTKLLEEIYEIFINYIELSMKNICNEFEGKEENMKLKMQKISTHMIPKIIYLVTYSNDIIKHLMRHDINFYQKMTISMRNIFAKGLCGFDVSEVLTQYLDDLMRLYSIGKIEEKNYQENVENALYLLNFLYDKDIFAEFLHKKLSVRLLNDDVMSDDSKSFLVLKLKNIVGAHLTLKMEGMIKDIKLMREKQQYFKDYIDYKNEKKNYDFNVLLLTSGFWPAYKTSQIQIPSDMQDLQDSLNSYQDFFKEKISNSKRIVWIHNLDNMTLKVSIKKRNYEINMNFPQALICLLFNNNSEYKIKDIQNILAVDFSEIKKIIHPMIFSKVNILNLYNTENKDAKIIEEESILCINEEFQSKILKIKIPSPSNHVEEGKKVKQDVSSERKYSIDASIVRTMKARKTLQHNQLLIEVHQQLSHMFVPNIKIIKQRVENLIEREFLQRSSENSNIYEYIA